MFEKFCYYDHPWDLQNMVYISRSINIHISHQETKKVVLTADLVLKLIGLNSQF